MSATNSFVSPLLTDQYQLTMAYGYWEGNRHDDRAVFDLFFRKCPFDGEFAIFAGLEEVLKFVEDFHFTDDDIAYIKSIMPDCKTGFFEWLKVINCSEIKIYAPQEGTVVFPRMPLIRVEGPLAAAQLLETTLLNLINFPSLVTTNAARFKLAAGWDKTLLEFGLRRAQGPDGGVSASRYSYMGGFDATSNVLAGKLFNIPVKGTHAHSFVQSFSGLGDLKDRTLTGPDGKKHDFVNMVLQFRRDLGFNDTNEGELAAFIAYAQAFPNGFLALVDTYDTLKSGVPNFLCVALALDKIGYRPLGIRLDSGDLAYLSKEARKMLRWVGERYSVDLAGLLAIVASNDINEPILHSLNQQGHEIDIYGIGTHIATCQAQPAFGGVYKLVEINGKPRIKISQEIGKMTIPGRKEAYRLVGENSHPLLDLMSLVGERPPQVGNRILCRHPLDEAKRVYVTPRQVIPLHSCAWNDGAREHPCYSLGETRQYVLSQLKNLRDDHLRTLNPTPYKVAASPKLFELTHKIRKREAPVSEIE